MLTISQMFNLALRRLSKRWGKTILALLLLLLPTIVMTLVNSAFDGVMVWKYGMTSSDAMKYWLEAMRGAEINEAAVDMNNVNAIMKIYFSYQWILGVLTAFATLVTALPLATYFLRLVNNENASVKEAYKKCLKGIPLALLMGLKIFLWALLFVIPGIIKTFAYSQAFYVKCENPDMSANECLKRSEQIMRGKKGKLFFIMLIFGLVSGVIESILTTFLFFALLGALFIIGETAYLQLISSFVMYVVITIGLGVLEYTMIAIFYESAKRDYIDRVEGELRMQHESGGSQTGHGDPFADAIKVQDVEEQPDYNKKDDDPFRNNE